ncbi:hypothetical protein B0H14DRAFT_2463122, partial [Mycena olivaceomarginata]
MSLDDVCPSSILSRMGDYGRDPGAAPSSTPAREIVVSNLPLDVNEAQVKELFHTTVGRLREVKVHFDIAGRSTGVATIVFCKNGDGNCAFAQYNNRAID